MNIAIIGLENFHFAYINAVIQICDVNKNNIIMFVSEEISNGMKEYLGNDYYKIEWSIYKNTSKKITLEKLAKINYLFKVSFIINDSKFSKVIFCSPEYNFSLYFMLFLLINKNIETVLTIHNINSVLDPNPSKRLKDRMKDIIRKFILDKVQAFAVLEDELKTTILQFIDKPIYIFPELFLGVKEINSDESFVSFAVPGIIQESRRDYEIIISVFEKIFLKYTCAKLIILGSGYDQYAKNVIMWCKDKRDLGYNVQWYEKFININEFEQQLSQVDVIINPSNVYTHGLSGRAEIYGKTKAAGAIFDIIRHAKPGIFPDEFSIPSKMKNSIVTYSSEMQLFELIEKIILDKKYLNKLKVAAMETSLKYIKSEYNGQIGLQKFIFNARGKNH